MKPELSKFDPPLKDVDQMVVYVHGLEYASGTQVLLLIFTILKEWETVQGWRYRYHPIDRVLTVLQSVITEMQNGNHEKP